MKLTLGLTLAALLLLGACGSKRTVVVGSKRGIEDNIVGEVVAQHLENRWEGQVRRRLTSGDTAILYQSIMGGDVTVYPDYTGTIVTEILKEAPPADAGIAFERSRSELKRTVRFDVLDPLGYDNRSTVAVRAADAADIRTVSEAAARKEGWKIGVTSEFELSSWGVPALTDYDLPQAAPVRGMAPERLFPGLVDGSLSLVVTPAGDGHLLSNEWKALEDDKGVFPPQQAVLVVRDDALAEDPSLKNALLELSGKITLEAIREMSKKVVIDERAIPDVAREFLEQAGLKK